MVVWSKPATRDLKRIYDYIASDSIFYAKKVIQDIVEKSERLSDFPFSGRIVPEVEIHYLRELLIYSYRLIYKVSADKIEILAVIHGKQDFLSVDIDDRR